MSGAALVLACVLVTVALVAVGHHVTLPNWVLWVAIGLMVAWAMM